MKRTPVRGGKEPETIRLQAVGALLSSDKCDGVPFA